MLLWKDVRKEMPPKGALVLAVYMNAFMRGVHEQVTLAYFDKKDGWFVDGLNKPLVKVTYWAPLPDLPYDPRFSDLSKKDFDFKFSSDTFGNLGPKTILRKNSDVVEVRTCDIVEPEDLEALKAKFSKKELENDDRYRIR